LLDDWKGGCAPGFTVAENSTDHPKIACSNPGTGTARELRLSAKWHCIYTNYKCVTTEAPQSSMRGTFEKVNHAAFTQN